MGDSLVRVLVVDDYEPWRRYIRSTLKEQPQLQVIGEASDGLEAVERAKELQPDLILIDIGLPSLNGIEATGRIRELAPKTRILVVSEMCSRDIAEEALLRGASGYVLKLNAASDLFPAVEAVLQGKQFVSASLTGSPLADSDSNHTAIRSYPGKIVELIPRQNVQIPQHHEVGFYSDDRRLLRDVVRFVEATLNVGNAAVVAATEPHQESLLSELQAHGLDMRAMLEQGRYVALDAHHTISMFMLNGVIDPDRFLERFGDLIVASRETTKVENPRVSVFGECVHLLWASGNAEAAIQMEKLGNKLTQIHEVDIFCGYMLSKSETTMNHTLFQRICAEHSAVYSH